MLNKYLQRLLLGRTVTRFCIHIPACQVCMHYLKCVLASVTRTQMRCKADEIATLYVRVLDQVIVKAQPLYHQNQLTSAPVAPNQPHHDAPISSERAMNCLLRDITVSLESWDACWTWGLCALCCSREPPRSCCSRMAEGGSPITGYRTSVQNWVIQGTLNTPKSLGERNGVTVAKNFHVAGKNTHCRPTP